MIRSAIDKDFPSAADNECLVRILALRRTYGPNAGFIRYYADDNGALAAIMDGVAILNLKALNDEWSLFLMMNPDINRIHCSDTIGHALLKTLCWRGRVGDVMFYKRTSPIETDDSVCTEVYLPTVYDLLKEHFPDITPFEYWYPDVSHRVRHGHCHIAVVKDSNRVISTAMTVAETEADAILGQIATHPDFRRRGLAGKCIKSTILQCKDKSLYILPLHESAKQLYEKLGFVTVGGWAELQRN